MCVHVCTHWHTQTKAWICWSVQTRGGFLHSHLTYLYLIYTIYNKRGTVDGTAPFPQEFQIRLYYELRLRKFWISGVKLFISDGIWPEVMRLGEGKPENREFKSPHIKWASLRATRSPLQIKVSGKRLLGFEVKAPSITEPSDFLFLLTTSRRCFERRPLETSRPAQASRRYSRFYFRFFETSFHQTQMLPVVCQMSLHRC